MRGIKKEENESVRETRKATSRQSNRRLPFSREANVQDDKTEDNDQI